MAKFLDEIPEGSKHVIVLPTLLGAAYGVKVIEVFRDFHVRLIYLDDTTEAARLPGIVLSGDGAWSEGTFISKVQSLRV